MTTEEKKKTNTPAIIVGVLVVIALAVVAFIAFANKGADSPTEPDFPPVNIPTPPADGPTLTANVAVNVRTGPSVKFDSYGVAPVGAKGEAIGVNEDGTWWVVRLPVEIAVTGQGWVSGKYVTAENTDGLPVVPSPELPPDVEVPIPDPNAATVTALDVINIRSGPGTTYPSYGLAHAGAKGEVLGVSTDSAWWVVKIPPHLGSTGQGWVSADWVLFENPNGVEIPVIPAP